jgi:tetratricopeptide (TPR) repeat protein
MGDPRRDDLAKLEMLYAEHPEGRIFTHLAEAYRRAGQLDRARAVVEAGLERHGDYASAHVVHGRVLRDEGRVEEAAAAFQRVLDLDPQNQVALRAIGDIARETGRSAEASQAYRELLTMDPGNEEVRTALAALDPDGVPPAPSDEEAVPGLESFAGRADEEAVAVEPDDDAIAAAPGVDEPGDIEVEAGAIEIEVGDVDAEPVSHAGPAEAEAEAVEPEFEREAVYEHDDSLDGASVPPAAGLSDARTDAAGLEVEPLSGFEATAEEVSGRQRTGAEQDDAHAEVPEPAGEREEREGESGPDWELPDITFSDADTEEGAAPAQADAAATEQDAAEDGSAVARLEWEEVPPDEQHLAAPADGEHLAEGPATDPIEGAVEEPAAESIEAPSASA